MISLAMICQNLYADVLVWAWAFLAGYPVSRWLPRRLGLAGFILCGIAYWAAALYVFPFPHGLDVAAGLAVLGACGLALAETRFRALSRKRSRVVIAQVILLVGCLAYGSILFLQYVPPGMDASMHSTTARLIAIQSSLPKTYAPFASQIDFPAVNLGVPALAGIAVRCGCLPTSAILATEHLTFAAFILASYALLRLWVRPSAGAVLAVFAVWGAAGAQKTVEWGGFTTVASVALGVFATRLLFDVVHRPSYRAGVPLGLVVAGLPLVQGVGAAGWLYAIAPIVALRAATFGERVRNPLPDGRLSLVLRSLMAGVVVAGLILTAYLAFARPSIDQHAMAWTREWVAQNAPPGEGWMMLATIPAYLLKTGGHVGIVPGLIAAGLLLVERRWRPFLGLASVALMLCLLCANARFYKLPLSFLLYPDRMVYWGTPLSAVAMALAWRYAPPALRNSRAAGTVLAVSLLGLAANEHLLRFQSLAIEPAITAEEWEALRWAGSELGSHQALVSATYQTAGSYLPAVAGIATDAWHMHHFAKAGMDKFLSKRRPTHTFVCLRKDPTGGSVDGNVVFRNAGVVIRELTGPGKR